MVKRGRPPKIVENSENSPEETAKIWLYLEFDTGERSVASPESVIVEDGHDLHDYLREKATIRVNCINNKTGRLEPFVATILLISDDKPSLASQLKTDMTLAKVNQLKFGEISQGNKRPRVPPKRLRDSSSGDEDDEEDQHIEVKKAKNVDAAIKRQVKKNASDLALRREEDIVDALNLEEKNEDLYDSDNTENEGDSLSNLKPYDFGVLQEATRQVTVVPIAEHKKVTEELEKFKVAKASLEEELESLKSSLEAELKKVKQMELGTEQLLVGHKAQVEELNEEVSRCRVIIGEMEAEIGTLKSRSTDVVVAPISPHCLFCSQNMAPTNAIINAAKAILKNAGKIIHITSDDSVQIETNEVDFVSFASDPTGIDKDGDASGAQPSEQYTPVRQQNQVAVEDNESRPSTSYGSTGHSASSRMTPRALLPATPSTSTTPTPDASATPKRSPAARGRKAFLNPNAKYKFTLMQFFMKVKQLREDKDLQRRFPKNTKDVPNTIIFQNDCEHGFLIDRTLRNRISALTDGNAVKFRDFIVAMLGEEVLCFLSLHGGQPRGSNKIPYAPVHPDLLQLVGESLGFKEKAKIEENCLNPDLLSKEFSRVREQDCYIPDYDRVYERDYYAELLAVLK